ncbi:unnamed protein product [Closterium sp. NIES-64]|nr:unnamed protein product [Closterium sp. NIES-64]
MPFRGPDTALPRPRRRPSAAPSPPFSGPVARPFNGPFAALSAAPSPPALSAAPSPALPRPRRRPAAAPSPTPSAAQSPPFRGLSPPFQRPFAALSAAPSPPFHSPVAAQPPCTRAAEQPSRRAAEPPSSRAARQSSRRAAEPPDHRAALQPSSPTAEPPSSRACQTTKPPCSRGARAPSRPAAEPPSRIAAEALPPVYLPGTAPLACDTRYRAALPAEFCAKNPPPPMYITLYYIVTRLPDSLRVVRDHFLSVCPTTLTINLLEKALLAAEKSIVAIGASRGDPRTPVFEGCSPSPLLPSVASIAAADLVGFESIGVASAPSGKRRTGKGRGGQGRWRGWRGRWRWWWR